MEELLHKMEGDAYDRIIDKMNGFNARFGFKLGDDGRPVKTEE